MEVRNLAEVVMRQRPATLPMNATVQEACRVMRDRRIGAMLITGADGQLAGVFTGRDAVGRVAAEGRDPGATALGAVMTTAPDTIGPKARAIDALRMMRDGGYRHLPVVSDGRIVGIASHSDFTGLEKAKLDEESGFWEIL